MKSLKAKLGLALFKMAGFLPLPLARALGAGLGKLSYHLNLHSTKVTRRNLSYAMPALEKPEPLIKASMEETGKTALEICLIWGQKPERTLHLIQQIEGEALVKQELTKGQGLIVLAPHLGNWEMLSYYLAQLGDLITLYQPPKEEHYEATILKSRAKAGSDIAPANIKGVATVLKHLRNGGLCGILPDQNPNDANSGAFCDFFGQPALTMTLVHKLLQKTEARAVFAFAKRVPKGFDLCFRSAEEGIYSDDHAQSLLALNRGIEHLVLEAPSQYQWEYKRYKARLDKNKPRYGNLV